jgi:hypothetical protein
MLEYGGDKPDFDDDDNVENDRDLAMFDDISSSWYLGTSSSQTIVCQTAGSVSSSSIPHRSSTTKITKNAVI